MISDHDKELIIELINSNIDMQQIAEKFDVHIFEIIKKVYGCDFDLTSDLVDRYFKRGDMKISELGLEKKCSRCLLFFPLFKEFWHCFNTKNKIQLSPHCKACESVRKRKQRDKI
ncbi:hypothetical protein ACU5DF_23735 [Aliivibrio wodanis]|uniref:hypothetical protein n=1 Tax=Aliivibrio wodanis TaxID=80852 RepID=UPI00406C6C7D